MEIADDCGVDPISTGVRAGDQPTGELRIRAERYRGRTFIAESYRTVPFHPGPPAYRFASDTADVIVQDVGPGRMPGDRLRVEIVAGTGARLRVLSQGANRIYPSADGSPVTEDVHLSADNGASLVWLPGEIIPYRNAVLRQRVSINVARGGSVAVGEIVTPGRVAMGEVYAFERLEIGVEACYDNHLVLRERSTLEPSRRPLHVPGRHGRNLVAGALYFVGEHDPAESPAIDDLITWGAAWGTGYGVVRFLGPTTQRVSTAMGAFLKHARPR